MGGIGAKINSHFSLPVAKELGHYVAERNDAEQHSSKKKLLGGGGGGGLVDRNSELEGRVGKAGSGSISNR